MDVWRLLAREIAATPALRLRVALLAAAALAGLVAGFVVPDATLADRLLRRCGYVLMLGAFAGFAWTLYNTRTPWRGWRALRQAHVWLAGVVLGGLLWLALVGEPRGFKVVHDEFVLQATARALHREREPAAVVRAYPLEGVFTPLVSYIDKRPLAFPFLVSLVHDVTGYRVLNGFLVNHALAILNVVLVYMLALRLSRSTAAALAAAALWGGLPLFAQNANGSGMEMLNATLLAGVMLLAWRYLEAPAEPRAAALVMAAVLLAQTRYESAMYVPVVMLVVVAGWWVARRVIVPWELVAAPLLLLPYAWQHQITTASRAMWELQPDQETRFGVSYLAANLRAAVEFLFAWNNRMIANSWLLSALAVVAGVFALVALVRRARTRRLAPGCWSVVALSAAALANLGLLMFYYWGRLNDPVAARLALPALLVGTLTVAWWLGWLSRRRIDPRWALGAVLVYTIAFMRPQTANSFYSRFNQVVQQVRWEKTFIAQREPAERLVITNKSVLPWLLEEQPAILLGHARTRRQELRFHLEAGTFGEILVTQRLQPSTPEGGFVVDPADALPPDYKLEPLGEKRFGATVARISRLAAVGPDQTDGTSEL